MNFKIKIRHVVGILIGLAIVIFSFLFLFELQSRWFKPLIGIGVFFMLFQFWLDSMRENKRQKEVEVKFLEFIRAVSDGVKSGIPIPKAIRELKGADYGALNPYVNKLIYQIEWGIPLRDSFVRFGKSTNNKVVKRAMTIIVEAEESGGNIASVLDSVVNSVLQIRKIGEERKTNTFSQLIQGYFIFFIFVGIMVVLQVYLLPQLSDIGVTALAGSGMGFGGGGYGAQELAATINFNIIFIGLILIQGFFSGLLIGKFSEGKIMTGLKHSLIMMLVGYLIFSSMVGY
jgi:archaeal flagellar protein FlaJ